MTRTWDCIVIGAGPAGALAAYGLASKGLSVLIVDKARFPRPKVCGCCLNHRALSALRRAGLGDFVDRLPGNPLTGIHIAADGKKLSLPLPGGWAVSRDHLDSALLRTAVDAGAVFCSGTAGRILEVTEGRRAVELTKDGDRQTEFAGVVLMATGLAGADESRPESAGSRFGAGTLLNEAPDFYLPGLIYMACAEEGYAGLVRIEGGRVNLAAALDPGRKRGNSLLVGKVVGQILDKAGLPVPPGLEDAAWKGTPFLTREAESLAGERYFVLGDAAGYSEPFTGEGMGWAFDSAVYLADLVPRALRDWNIRYAKTWESWYKNKILPYRRLSLWISRLLRKRGLRKAGFLGLSGVPVLARPWTRYICEGPSAA